MIMIGDSLGVAPEDRDDLLRWSDEMLKGQDANATEEMMLTAATAFADYTAYATDVIAKRRVEPHDDLMSDLVHAEVDGDRLSDDELIHESLLILVGGDETTRHVISEGMYQLLLHPDQWQKLLDDRDVLSTAVEELLRWVSPIKNMARAITKDVVVGDQQLTAGEELILLYASANRDEAAFDHPERFDVERDPNDHVAFGFGSHFCLGNSLARLEIKVMLDRLLTRLPDLSLDLPDGQRPTFRPANFISGPEALPVTFTPTPPLGAFA
jgi:cytochrome P450 family 142 subfamily A polypeptide 1